MTVKDINSIDVDFDAAPRGGFPMALLFWAHVVGAVAGIAAGVSGFGFFASLGIAWASAVSMTLTLPFLPMIGGGFRNTDGSAGVEADLAAWAEDVAAEQAAARNRREAA